MGRRAAVVSLVVGGVAIGALSRVVSHRAQATATGVRTPLDRPAGGPAPIQIFDSGIKPPPGEVVIPSPGFLLLVLAIAVVKRLFRRRPRA